MFNEIAYCQKIWFAHIHVCYLKIKFTFFNSDFKIICTIHVIMDFFLPHTGLGPGYALDFATPRNAAQTCLMFPWMCHN